MDEPTSSTPPEFVSADVDMNLAGVRVQLTLTVPSGPVPVLAILPVFQSLCDAVGADVASDLEAKGKPISCKAGCGACCRQLVPITQIEARNLAALVESMPEPRRTAVRARFVDAVSRLETAGILETLRHLDRVPREERESLGLAYFAQGIPCPFLEDESCSIHSDRPLICREYLVTSPPIHCANPSAKLVEGVKPPVHVSTMLAQFGNAASSDPPVRVLLPLALEWAATHPEIGPTRPGPEWVNELFRSLSGRESSGSPCSPESVTTDETLPKDRSR